MTVPFEEGGKESLEVLGHRQSSKGQVAALGLDCRALVLPS